VSPQHPAGTSPPPATPAGLQAERTRLAWRRTALGLAANAVLMALRLPHSSVPALTWAVVLGEVTVGVVAFGWAGSREHELADPDRPPRAAPARITALGVLVTLLTVLVGIDLVLA